MRLQQMLDYLTELSLHNERVWFHANKAAYRGAVEQFEALVGALIEKIGAFDPSVLHNDPKNLTFKLIRDTRFSRDKSPYNPAFRAHIAANGKQPVPVGYYVMLKPGGQSFLGGGLFADVFRDATRLVRAYIAQNGGEWEQILHEPAFSRHFTVQGAALKNVPAEYPAEHPQADYLKMKSWYLEYPLRDDQLGDAEDFVKSAADIFHVMQPFNDYLNRALADFQMPSR